MLTLMLLLKEMALFINHCEYLFCVPILLGDLFPLDHTTLLKIQLARQRP
jgi:hypothetical protein